MKSIQTKVLMIIFSSMVSVIILISLISFNLLHTNVTKLTNENMLNICQNKKEELNNVLSSIEQSVNIIANTSQSKITSLEMFKDDSKYNSYITEMEELFLNISNNTNGAVAFYYRLDPELKDSVSGFFWNNDNGVFKKVENTNLNEFDDNDLEHVGWFYVPKNNGKPTWLMPYKNLNINIYMISYVIPIYYNNQFIGVIGMDVDFNVLTEKLEADIEYDTGIIYLAYENKIIYHDNYPYDSTRVVNDNITETETSLINNMSLVLSIYKSEIVAEQTILIATIGVTSTILLAIFIFITYYFTRNVIKPLKDLTAATKKVLEGEYDIHVESNSNDEIGVLANSFNKTITVIHEKLDYINALAFKDSLTSAMSNHSYISNVERINQILNEKTSLNVIVFDVNNLKLINDTYGHECGNALLIKASSAITTVFNHVNTYRIGGDEFVVVIENESEENINILLNDFEKMVNQSFIELAESKEKIEVAYGYARYDHLNDSCFEDVFNRADFIMYENKRKMKSSNR